MAKRVAVVLAGCGVYDGSEIHEASAVLVHLSRGGAAVQMFAPNIDQMHVVNHLKGEPSEEKRNVLVESARLARGNIQDLSKLSVKDHDAIIFPGGFGAAKNLCTWAVQGKDCSVNDEVKATLQAFHSEGKPIGLCCISPVLAAKVLPGCEVTVGIEKDNKTLQLHDHKSFGRMPVLHLTRKGVKNVSRYRWHGRSHQPAGLHTRQQERRREPRGREEQTGHHLRLHVRRSYPRDL
ncbi:Glutamine amidotransferase-like class 1 domain-containing protein 3A, mitochondrial [Ataeniobius toweri]|uniref:Glutamine amidotransferase-like class 1 domain-containing protein 3A, mitochondrial n=1 Tax=Ataeniobius toweri TaxID=208326 RepID=A0ABU7ADI1_9TELE|nr:Glutamine amidotransferase-like class 1 domain-containing protein 3A, mitochondrial [Ataeniobius toweri]